MYYLVMDEIEIGPAAVKRIKDLMTARKVKSQSELARLAGVNRSTISYIFSGRQGGSAETLTGIAAALKTTVDYIRGTTGDPRRSDADPLPEYALELIETMKQLGSIQRQELLLIAKTFVDNNEELHRHFLREMRATIYRMADEGGRGNELDEYINKRIDKLLGDGTDKLLPPSDNNDEQDTGGGEKPDEE